MPRASHLPSKKKAMVQALAETGTIKAAAATVGVNRRTHTRWMQDPKYRDAVARAMTDAGDMLEQEAIRRAAKGVTRPVGFYKGAPSAYVQEYSDTLLIFLLKGFKPEKYGDRLEVSGKFASADLTQLLNRLPDDQLARVLSGADPRLVLAEWAETQLGKILPSGRDVSAMVDTPSE